VVFAAYVRSVGTIIVVPMCLVQVLLIIAGRYGYHRWTGRCLLHIWNWISVMTICLTTDSTSDWQ